MKISVLKRKARNYHKYIGFATSFFILYLVITGVLLLYSDETGIEKKFINNRTILEKYNLSTEDDVKVVLNLVNKKNDLIVINEKSIYFQNRYIDSIESDILAGLYKNNSIYLLSNKNLVIYSFEDLSDSIELKDIKFYKVTSAKYNNNPNNPVDKDVIFVTKDNIKIMLEENSAFKKTGLKDLKFKEPILAEKKIARTYLNIHQGSGVSLHRIITELHNGKFFGSVFIFILFISSLSIIFLVLSSFLFGINYRRRK